MVVNVEKLLKMVIFQNLSKMVKCWKMLVQTLKNFFAVIFFYTIDIKNTIFNPKFYQHFLPSLYHNHGSNGIGDDPVVAHLILYKLHHHSVLIYYLILTTRPQFAYNRVCKSDMYYSSSIIMCTFHYHIGNWNPSWKERMSSCGRTFRQVSFLIYSFKCSFAARGYLPKIATHEHNGK